MMLLGVNIPKSRERVRGAFARFWYFGKSNPMYTLICICFPLVHNPRHFLTGKTNKIFCYKQLCLVVMSDANIK